MNSKEIFFKNATTNKSRALLKNLMQENHHELSFLKKSDITSSSFATKVKKRKEKELLENDKMIDLMKKLAKI